MSLDVVTYYFSEMRKNESLKGINVVLAKRRTGKTSMLYDLMIDMARDNKVNGDILIPHYLFITPRTDYRCTAVKDKILNHIACDKYFIDTPDKLSLLGKNSEDIPVMIDIIKAPLDSTDYPTGFYDGIFIDEPDYMDYHFFNDLYYRFSSEYVFTVGTTKYLVPQQDTLLGKLKAESLVNDDIYILRKDLFQLQSMVEW